MGVGRPHVEVNERRVRVVAHPDIAERSTEIAQGFVRDPTNGEVERAADVVIGVRRELSRRVGSKSTDHLEFASSEVIAHHGHQRHQAGVDGVRRSRRETAGNE